MALWAAVSSSKRLLYNVQWTRVLHTSGRLLEPSAPTPVPLSKLKDSFNDGTSISYLEELEERYNKDPNSVDRSWAGFFRNLGEPRGEAAGCTVVAVSPPSSSPKKT